MSHSVTITRTTTTTTSTAIILNTGYLKTAAGLLKLAQTILGAICIGLIASAIGKTNYTYYLYNTEALYFTLAVSAFLITTAILLFSCLISFVSASMIHKTVFELNYHIVGFVMLLAAGIVFLVTIKDNGRHSYYNICLSAAIICIINSALYLFSAVLAFRTYRGAGL